MNRDRDPSERQAMAILRELRQGDEYLSPHRYIAAGIVAERKRCADLIKSTGGVNAAVAEQIAAVIMAGERA